MAFCTHQILIKNMLKKSLILFIFFTAFIIVARLIPHLPNFVPLTAIALFLGAYLGKKQALVLPVLGLLVSDLILGLYNWQLMLAVYGSFAMIGVFSWWLNKKHSALSVLGMTLLSSTFFFLTTNWAVWMFSPWYAKNLSGLAHCFTLALPFFRYTLLGDLFYVLILFGSYALIRKFAKQPILVVKNKIF